MERSARHTGARRAHHIGWAVVRPLVRPVDRRVGSAGETARDRPRAVLLARSRAPRHRVFEPAVTAAGPFSAGDFQALSRLVVDAWRAGLDRDWSVPAGTLEWSCLQTADHTVDCVFSYALFLASRREDAYPPFGELHALPQATPADIVNGLQAVSTMLWAVVATAEPDARAVILMRPHETGGPDDFAARGALEMVLHAHDVCIGLGIAFRPPQDICERLRDHTRDWPQRAAVEPTADAWGDLLERSGRARPTQ